MGFLSQEYRNGLTFPSPRDLPDPGIKPESPALAGIFFMAESSGKPLYKVLMINLGFPALIWGSSSKIKVFV